MRRIVVLAMMAGFGQSPAWAESSSGSSALALAALVGLHAPALSYREKLALGLMLDGRLGFPFPSAATIALHADAVTCRLSDVDIAEHDCTLTFGAARRTLRGRAAHELYATLVEVGVPSDGAAGSIFEALTNLACVVKPSEVKQRGGGGADCSYAPGP